MNAPVKIDMPLTNEARKRAAIAEARARFHDAWMKISADLQAEERRIERDFS